MKEIQPVVVTRLEDLTEFWNLRHHSGAAADVGAGVPEQVSDRTIVTIGNFDGFHLGHRQLIERVVRRARNLNIPSIVLTFDPHPVQVLFPERGLTRLFSTLDQVQVLRELGIDVLVRLPFSREFSQLSGAQFVKDVLLPYFRPQELIVGHDFSFGANKSGNLQVLTELSRKSGFQLDVVPAVLTPSGEIISSSRIRTVLTEGDVSAAAAMLSRYFFVHGWVERGAGRGRTIGVPTANLRVSSETLPRTGVYAVRVHRVLSAKVREREAHSAQSILESWNGVANIGRNPTFTDGSHPLSLEVHILDFSGDLYGVELRVEFLRPLRDEMKFSSAQDLVAQIKLDIMQARTVHQNLGFGSRKI